MISNNYKAAFGNNVSLFGLYNKFLIQHSYLHYLARQMAEWSGFVWGGHIHIHSLTLLKYDRKEKISLAK